MKERTEISIPSKPLGREGGHLLKCCETVVSMPPDQDSEPSRG